ncbi:glycosyltransferase family 2 protein [Gelidibacter mesophilus]|uniref:glycosyltransferase family 2 protein n=1 Tax=Gelidibacter mesophilus TaxID=169050 RepID=UPI000A0347CE|nr:glycosyltransferase family A protein [Gelidibacter mesophilus]
MKISFEILISTMFREDLSFLNAIFSLNAIDDFDIIIVNQTDEDKWLVSDRSNIKVINSLERGSPASRNLAIRHASKDVCLMGDDDIVYQPNLKQHIEAAYSAHPNVAMISFEAINEEGQLFTDYYPEGLHSKKSLKKIFTWVISFKRQVFKEHQIYFNHYFGVGSVFEGETEYAFLRSAYDKGLKMIHVSQTIVRHPNESSGGLMGSDNALFARSALAHRFYGNLSYLWLLKYVLFIYRHHYISFKEMPTKFQMGLNGIAKYKSLLKSGEIDKLYEG